MEIDNNDRLKEALALGLEGKNKECWVIQDAFLDELHAAKENGEDTCPCKSACKLHGRCADCVAVHRGHMDHLPVCFHNMINEKLRPVSALTEHSMFDK